MTDQQIIEFFRRSPQFNWICRSCGAYGKAGNRSHAASDHFDLNPVCRAGAAGVYIRDAIPGTPEEHSFPIGDFESVEAAVKFSYGILSKIWDLRAQVKHFFQTIRKEIMSTQNSSLANLQAAEAAIEAAFGSLETAVNSEVADFQSEIVVLMKQVGVPASSVDQVTQKLTAFGQRVSALVSVATGADPGPQLAIVAPTMPSAQEGVAVSIPAPAVTGGKAPVTISVSGLPNGVTAAADGSASGTPATGTAGTASIVYTATDGAGTTASVTASMVIAAAAVAPAPQS